MTGVEQIGLYPRQRLEKMLFIFIFYADESLDTGLHSHFLHGVDDIARLRTEEKQPYAPVLGMASPLHEATFLELVQDPDQGNGTDLQRFGQRGLMYAFVA